MKFSLKCVLLMSALAGSAAVAAPLPPVELYKNPGCECCVKWAEHLKKNGFKVAMHDVSDLPGQRRKLGIPDVLASCHSAKIGAYVVEGHVPAADIKRLLKEKPKAKGLAVPAMPAGSPGMDIPNSPPYETLIVAPDGSTRVFAKH